MNPLQSSNRLLLTVVFIVLWVFNGKSQSNTGKYSDYDRGYRLMYYGNVDSAFLMFNRYINNPADSLKKGQAYRYMGEMQRDIGDLYGAQENLTNTISILDPLKKNHREDIGYAYYMLGNVSLDLKQYDEAISFYNQATPFFKEADFLTEVMNSKATALQKKKAYKDALAVYDSIFALKPAEQQLVARITDNKARTKWLQNPGYIALPEFWLALKIRTEGENNPGLNASYAHLADYYENEKPDSALWYAQKMLDKAKENQSAIDIQEAIEKLIRLNSLPAAKDRWFAEYKILSDSLQSSRDTTRNRFALIRYDVQKSKADNLVLQQHITKQRLLMYGLTALAIISIAGFWLWYRKRRKRVKQEAENAIRELKLKTSQKIHDVVANGLYGIMNELEHGKAIEKELLITRIEGLYEKSRDISYEVVSLDDNIPYSKHLHDQLIAFSDEETNVFIIGNSHSFWNRINTTQKQELQLVLTELMVNMKKHSGAKNAVLEFKQEANTAYINYKDDGTGFPDSLELGNGLNNTVSRINSLHGEVIFGKGEKAGASVAISFPLEPSKL